MNLDHLSIQELARAGGCKIEQYFVIFLPCQKLKSLPKKQDLESLEKEILKRRIKNGRPKSPRKDPVITVNNGSPLLETTSLKEEWLPHDIPPKIDEKYVQNAMELLNPFPANSSSTNIPIVRFYQTGNCVRCGRIGYYKSGWCPRCLP